jgi:hypothetical protein
MPWGRRAREIEELRKRVDQLTQMLSQQHQPAGLDLGQILGSLIEGGVKQLGSTTEFVRAIHEMGTERLAREYGKRGGRKRAATAARDSRGRMIAGPQRRAGVDPNCILCIDSSASNFTVQEWEAHQLHKNGRAAAAPQQEPREVEIEVQAPVPVPGRYPLPNVATGDEDIDTHVHHHAGDTAQTNGVHQADVS